MKRFTFALTVLFLAVWAAVGNRAPEAPEDEAGGSPIPPDVRAARLLEQFDGLRKSLRGPGDPLQRLDEERRLLGEAEKLLAAARERLVSEYQEKKTQLEDEARALRDGNRQVKTDAARQFAGPARVPENRPPAARQPIN